MNHKWFPKTKQCKQTCFRKNGLRTVSRKNMKKDQLLEVPADLMRTGKRAEGGGTWEAVGGARALG